MHFEMQEIIVFKNSHLKEQQQKQWACWVVCTNLNIPRCVLHIVPGQFLKNPAFSFIMSNS